ncbi:Major facilitator superfamily domain, general substrate transporter, partial [Metarhizium majus ARSEF 297]
MLFLLDKADFPLIRIMASTAYAIGIPGMAKDFGIQNRTALTLGVSTYLFGLSLGPLVLAPISEMYGRRPVYIVSLFSFAILLIPSAVAPNLATILITRFMAAFMGSVVMSSAPGTLNELADEDTKTVYFSVWILGAVNGPVVGPVFAGIIFQYAGWRWIHWFLVILAFTSCAVMATIPETHSAVILRRRCEALKKIDDRYWCAHSQTMIFSERLKTSLSRPLAMAFTEPICLFWDFFVAIIYAILYLCIVGYPIVFSQIRGWPPAVASQSPPDFLWIRGRHCHLGRSAASAPDEGDQPPGGEGQPGCHAANHYRSKHTAPDRTAALRCHGAAAQLGRRPHPRWCAVGYWQHVGLSLRH